MGKFFLGAGLGVLLGALLAYANFGPMVGAGAGAGLAVGISSGACTTVSAAQELGLMSADQVDEVLTLAAARVNAATGSEPAPDLTGSAARCDELLAELRTALEG